MNGRHILVFCTLSLGLGAIALSEDADPILDFTNRLRAQGAADTPITVEIKRARFSAATQDVPGTRLQTLCFATVEAGGREIELDWSQSKAAGRELERNATLNHGDLREPRASLRGVMEFRVRKAGKGNEVYPVIVVESVNIELVHPYRTLRGVESVVP